MKKSVLLGVLALGMVASTATSNAQGHIEIGNYQGAYNAVMWGVGAPRAGLPVLSAEGVSLSLWYGEGNLSADALVNSIALTWKVGSENLGYPGYYSFTTVQLPTWNSGDTFTFQIRATGNGVVESASRSDTWTESGLITSSLGEPAPIPNRSTQSIGLTVVVPEPSSFALAGIGAAALMALRRRS
jgi:hypothetical protein